MAGTVYDKAMFTTSEYLIFFDNVRVDQFVRSWNCQASVDGGIGSASVDMIYVPDLYYQHSGNKSVKVGSQTIKDSSVVAGGIENMTNLRIFVKNNFTKKFACVFDGNIKSKTLSKNGSQYSISFAASDYMTWFTKTIVPLAVPKDQQLSFPDRMRWKAQGIDLENVPLVNQMRDLHFRGKTIEEMWKEISQRTISANSLYAKSDAAIWDNPLYRIVHMADIDTKYTTDQSSLDFVVTTSATSLNSIYAMMNDVIKTVLLEFFQSGDGLIRIKAPFWSEPVLKNHVIDLAMILGMDESVNWDNEYSRIIATGGLGWWQDDTSETDKSYITPSVAYRTDGTYSTSATNSENNSSGASVTDVTGATTGAWTDGLKVTSPYGYRTAADGTSTEYHNGIDYDMAIGDPVYHIGSLGTVSAAAYSNTAGGYEPNSRGNYITVDIDEGPYAGAKVSYFHLSSVNVIVGQKVKDRDFIGRAGNTGSVRSANGGDGSHLHLKVARANGEGMNPVYYMVETVGYLSSAAGNYYVSVGNDNLLSPTDYEKKYGPSIYNVSQPMIKFTSASQIATNRTTAFETLIDYSKFMLFYLNSVVNVATLQTIAMPWLKLGFNVWVDPVGMDRVYYLSSYSYQGSPDGVYMNLGLTMGRTTTDFVEGKCLVGSLRPGTSDNIFVNQMHKGYRVNEGDFGKIVGTKASDYEKFKVASLKFHMNIDTKEYALISSVASKYYSDLYGNGLTVVVTPTKKTETSEAYSAAISKIDPEDWPTLERGDSGAHVAELQTLLKNLKYNIKVDGKFGPDTWDAVYDFQKKNGLNKDGIVGPKTKQALAKKTTAKSSILSDCNFLLRKGYTGKYLEPLQDLLTDWGYYKGSHTKTFDSATEKAVVAFQKAHRLEDDGIVGPATIKALLS